MSGAFLDLRTVSAAVLGLLAGLFVLEPIFFIGRFSYRAAALASIIAGAISAA